MKLAANISLLFTDVPLLERFAAARAAGFTGVELLFPYELDPRLLKRQAQSSAIPIVQINSPSGNREAGEMGFAAVPGRERVFEATLRTALDFLGACGGSQVHVVAGVPPKNADPALVRATYVRNLQWAADTAASAGVRLTIEPINSRDIPGYALSTVAQALEVLKAVERPNIGLQLDLYHAQIMGGDITHRIRQAAPFIRHVQVAGAPERNEPDRGELQLSHVLRSLSEAGYNQWVSAEYRPGGRTQDSLGWMSLFEPFR